MNFERFFNNEQNKKEKSWEETLTWVNTIHDKLEKCIDKNIQETIVALTLLGINTSASCEGHIDHGTYAPYIDVETKERNDLGNRITQAIEKEDAKKIIKELQKKNLEERKKLVVLLAEFYENRKCSFESRLIIQSLSQGWSRLESQGAGLQGIQPEEIKKQKLEEYQKEMANFTSFLKQKFLKS